MTIERDRRFAEAAAMIEAGQCESALAIGQQLAAADKDDWRAWQLVAVAAQRLGRLDDAARALRTALDAYPKEPQLLNDLGRVELLRDNADAAVGVIRRLVNVAPNESRHWILLGRAQRAAGLLDAAERAFERALAQDKNAAAAYIGLGLNARARGDISGAVAAYRRATETAPNNYSAWFNLGNALTGSARPEDAVPCYRRAIALRPEGRESHYNLAQALLTLGHYEEGWEEYCWRWDSSGFQARYREYPLPLWHGEPLAGLPILLWREQGVGDEIMFASLLPDLVSEGARATVLTDVRLVSLFSRSFPTLDIAASGPSREVPRREPPLVCHAPIADLARTLRIAEASFPCHRGYLIPDASRTALLRRRYQAAKPESLLIGLAWHTTNPKTGPQRNIALADWTPILEQRGVRFVSLQYGDHEAEIAMAAAASGADIVVDGEVDQMTNLDDFAAQIAALDLIISIDNSAVHMAGALGKPTWTLLPDVPDWRWQLMRDDTPWYPAMRLFRQTGRGDWRPVIEAVAASLAGRIRNEAR